jgi:hypothetical protein
MNRYSKQNAQSWRVLSGISALSNRSTLMPGAKKEAPDGR